MKKIPAILAISMVILLSCQDDHKTKSSLQSIDSKTYYTEEIIPEGYRGIYGMWKLVDISGGFAGSGYENNFDFLEIKDIGIFGVVRDGKLLVHGKILIEKFDNSTNDHLQVKFVAENDNTVFATSYYYLDLQGGSLNLMAPCCDFFNFHFQKEN